MAFVLVVPPAPQVAGHVRMAQQVLDVSRLVEGTVGDKGDVGDVLERNGTGNLAAQEAG
jgi:hypothetical protein